MVKSLKYIIVIMTLLSIGFGQYKTDIQRDSDIFTNPVQETGLLSSIFNPNRFNMNHSFSMSMMSMGSQSIGVASYTNNMNFNLRDNLKLQTYMTLMQPKMLSNTMSNPYANTQVYFNAALDYNPTPNTHLLISFGNYPSYYNSYYASPFRLTRGY